MFALSIALVYVVTWLIQYLYAWIYVAVQSMADACFRFTSAGHGRSKRDWLISGAYKIIVLNIVSMLCLDSRPRRTTNVTHDRD
jgi:hypothetical protein